MNLKSLVTSLALQQIKEVGMVAKQEHIFTVQDIECTMLHLSIGGLEVIIIIKSRKLKMVKRTPVFKCSQNYAVHIRYSISCTDKIMKNGRKHTFIQNYRNVNP